MQINFFLCGLFSPSLFRVSRWMGVVGGFVCGCVEGCRGDLHSVCVRVDIHMTRSLHENNIAPLQASYRPNTVLITGVLLARATSCHQAPLPAVTVYTLLTLSPDIF